MYIKNLGYSLTILFVIVAKWHFTWGWDVIFREDETFYKPEVNWKIELNFICKYVANFEVPGKQKGFYIIHLCHAFENL